MCEPLASTGSSASVSLGTARERGAQQRWLRCHLGFVCMTRNRDVQSAKSGRRSRFQDDTMHARRCCPWGPPRALGCSACWGSWGWTPPTCWPWATARMTSRCSTWWAPAWLWATPCSRSAPLSSSLTSGSYDRDDSRRLSLGP